MDRAGEPLVQGDQEVESLRTWLLASRRDPSTKIVTKGHILNPPFEMTLERQVEKLSITVKGANDEFQIGCNRIILSRFRPNQVGLFTQDKSGIVTKARFIATLSKLYQNILDAFPPGCKFSSSELYAKVLRSDGRSQSHARRRWKELKYNYGFDVDLTPERQTYYRGKSEVPIRDPFLRPDDAKLRKEMLPIMTRNSNGEFECNNCGVLVRFAGEEAEEEDSIDPFALRKSRGLLDHRRPILQGGDDTLGNLQVLCETCNNLKATTCNKCPYSYQCDCCIWAHPEDVKANRLVLVLDNATAESIRSIGGSNLNQATEKILRAIASGKSKIEL